MTVIELKKRLIRKIGHTDNEELLEEMYRLIENEETDFSVYELSEEQKSAVEDAQRQYREGDILTDEQANNEIDEWLGK